MVVLYEGKIKMLTHQDFHTDYQGNYSLTNTFRVDNTLSEVARTNELNPGGRFKADNGFEGEVLGYIPEIILNNDMDMFLVARREALANGDPAKAQEYLIKYFENHQEFKVRRETKYWRGSRAVLL